MGKDLSGKRKECCEKVEKGTSMLSWETEGLFMLTSGEVPQDRIILLQAKGFRGREKSTCLPLG